MSGSDDEPPTSAPRGDAGEGLGPGDLDIGSRSVLVGLDVASIDGAVGFRLALTP